jgi:signal transduction histidine kinase
MKIKTQFHLLIVGILIVPVLLILGQVLYSQFIRQNNQMEIIMYEDIAAMVDTEMNFEDRGSFVRFMFGLSRLGDIAVLRQDFFVLYSTIPELTIDVYVPIEKILALTAQENRRYAYTLEFLEGIQGYILMRRDLSADSKFGQGLLFPVIVVFALCLFLGVFAIVMTLVIARSITKSVLVLENATRRIAEGELDITIAVKGSNEITSLTESLNKMRNELKEEELRRSRFIMGVTHDLKTPLALIKAYTEAIEDGITEDPATHASATEIISVKVDQLEGMINDLLEYVRMDSGEWRGQLQKTDITAFLQNAAREFSLDAELLHHEFQSELVLPVNLFVFMDEHLILRALENLVNNAISYTPDGSVIMLAAGLAGNTVQITVSDNGPGIDEADLPHVFEMFYRGTSSRREQSIGLGLAVVKWVMDSHGWSISVRNEAGTKKGTSFCITVPL